MRILLAEDNASLSKVVSAILQKSNYSVDAVGDGEMALEYIESGLYDAVILDIMMPKMDGLTVLKNVREKNNRIPIIMLTAKTEIEDKVSGLDMGANDYLTKPFDSRELLARLRVITRNEKQQDSAIKIANITLDTNTCVLSSPTGKYKLANKEYQMMEIFMSNYNKVISAEQLMDKIWSADSDSELNTVWSYISYLRRKLEALDSEVQISTKRNMGYVLEEK